MVVLFTLTKFRFIINNLSYLLQEAIEEEEEEEQEIILGRGNRARKETSYDDQLSEKDWLKAIGVRLLLLKLALFY